MNSTLQAALLKQQRGEALDEDERNEIMAALKPSLAMRELWAYCEQFEFGQIDDSWEDVVGTIIEKIGAGEVNGAEGRRLLTKAAVACDRRGIFLPDKWRDEGFWKWSFRKHGVPFDEHMAERTAKNVAQKTYDHDPQYHPQQHGKPNTRVIAMPWEKS